MRAGYHGEVNDMGKIPCEKCGKETIEVRDIPTSAVHRRGFTGKKGLQWSAGRTIYLTKKCPMCGHVVGENKVDHKKVTKRFKEQGLPTVIEC